MNSIIQMTEDIKEENIPSKRQKIMKSELDLVIYEIYSEKILDDEIQSIYQIFEIELEGLLKIDQIKKWFISLDNFISSILEDDHEYIKILEKNQDEMDIMIDEVENDIIMKICDISKNFTTKKIDLSNKINDSIFGFQEFY